MNRVLYSDTKITLKELTERFIDHNSMVYVYYRTYHIDNSGIKVSQLHLLERVMTWQITLPENDQYYKIHPDVKPARYRYNNVVSIVKVTEGCPNALDEIGVIIE